MVKKRTIIVMEAVTDYDICLWFCSIGWSGLHNYINMWGLSPLYKTLTDGFMNNIDLDYTVNGAILKFLKYFFSR